MSTVRQHLGLLWLVRNNLAPLNPQSDHAWAAQAVLFVGVHLDELIALAGGADIEDWVIERSPEIPPEFPQASPAKPDLSGLKRYFISEDIDGVYEHCKGDLLKFSDVEALLAAITKEPRQ